MRNLYTLAIAAILSHLSYSATITSKTSGNWSNASIWNGGIVPSVNDDVTRH